MRKFLICICFVFCLIPSSVFASVNVYERDPITLDVWDDVNLEDNKQDILSTPKVNEKEKVYDFANLFSTDEEEKLYDRIIEYINDYNYDMVIVTISENEKESSSSYADDFYDYNYFGIGDSYDGILYLIDMDKREIFISTSGNAITLYTDEFIDYILDEAFVGASSGDYYESAVSFIEESSYYVENYYIDDSGNLSVIRKVNWPLTLIVSIIFPTIVVLVMISSHKKVKLSSCADEYVDKSATKISISKDNFVTSNVSRVRIRSNSNNSSIGRSVGGSSTRIGSSGRIHGGGGRRF